MEGEGKNGMAKVNNDRNWHPCNKAQNNLVQNRNYIIIIIHTKYCTNSNISPSFALGDYIRRLNIATVYKRSNVLGGKEVTGMGGKSFIEYLYST